jgi:hypothetical protein
MKKKWKAYRLTYRLESPVHIGWHTLGYVRCTRYYIPGKSIWGALTANHIRCGDNSFQYKDYSDQGDNFRRNSRISYFFPALDPERPLLPHYTDSGLNYGKFNKADFERIFIKSFGQTAVTPQNNTAEDESLHEAEFISPFIKDEKSGEPCPVYFIGYIFLKDENLRWQTIEKSLERVFIGGDRKYGWGSMILGRHKEVTFKDKFFFDYEIDINDNEITVHIPAGKPVYAHLLAGAAALSKNIKGDIESLVGRDWGEVKNKEGNTVAIGAGQKISKASLCWMPGSVICLNAESFAIGPYGILEARPKKGSTE